MSRILKETEEEIKALRELGIVSVEDHDKIMKLTARTVAVASPKVYKGADIIAIRTRFSCSQKVLAEALCVTVDTVSKWERNERDPRRQACRLLDLLKQTGISELTR